MIAPVIVAVHVNGNDTVGVIDTVNDDSRVEWCTWVTFPPSKHRTRNVAHVPGLRPRSSTASIRPTVSFPFT